VKVFDRHGHPVSETAWTPAGELECGWVRIPDGSWLVIEPRATREAPWGLSDRLWHCERGAREPGATVGDPTQVPPGAVPLSVFEALDWARVDRIPALAAPARLPPGAGTAVLNLIAELARAQTTARLAYRGPYPTEQLFLALLESFRYLTDAPDPLAAFMAGGVEWEPAPHERLFPADGLYVQMRGRVEKVVVRGATYYRPDWQGVARHAPKRVRETTQGVVCSLWALGRPLEDHLLLSREGALLRVLDTEPVEASARVISPEVRAGVAAAVAAGSAPALAPFIRTVAATSALEWGAVTRELVSVEPGRIRVSERLRRVLAEALSAAHGRGARASLALVAVVELAALTGDTFRSLAQAEIAKLPPEAQAAAVTAGGETAPGDTQGAQEIAGAVEALLEELAA
jgi:hypothetical protein